MIQVIRKNITNDIMNNTAEKKMERNYLRIFSILYEITAETFRKT